MLTFWIEGKCIKDIEWDVLYAKDLAISLDKKHGEEHVGKFGQLYKTENGQNYFNWTLGSLHEEETCNCFNDNCKVKNSLSCGHNF